MLSYIESDKFYQHCKIIATKLLSSYRNKVIDVEDLTQDAFIGVWSKYQQYDPNKASFPTFANRLAKWTIQTKLRQYRQDNLILVKRQQYEKAKNRRHKPLIDSTSEPDRDLDIQTVLARLPVYSRDLCDKLPTQPVSAIAKELGIHKSAIYRKISAIRAVFVEAGLSGY